MDAVSAPEEVLPGVAHWATFHEGIRDRVHSHLHVPTATLFDPREPDEGGLDAVAALARPERIVLSNRHHLRHARDFVAAFGCEVLCHAAGLHEFAGGGGPAVRGFEFGAVLAPGVTALEVAVLTPEETAIHLAAGPGALLFADAVVHPGGGELGFVPDALLGDDPSAIKAGLRRAFARLLAEQEVDALLFAHGEPLPSGGRAALEAFVNLT